MPTLYLSLGTNLGDRQSNLKTALSLVSDKVGTVISQSGVFETEPWGYKSNNAFLNQAAAVMTELTPPEALEAIETIEKNMGRNNKSKEGDYADRIIDIDLIMYDDLVIETPTLKIPHPLMQQRRFVLEPLAEFASDMIHPLLKKSVGELLEESCGYEF